MKRSAFAQALAERQSDAAGRRWLFVPYDQLTADVGPLSREDPAELGIVMLENPWKAEGSTIIMKKSVLMRFIINFIQWQVSILNHGWKNFIKKLILVI